MQNENEKNKKPEIPDRIRLNKAVTDRLRKRKQKLKLISSHEMLICQLREHTIRSFKTFKNERKKKRINLYSRRMCQLSGEKLI